MATKSRPTNPPQANPETPPLVLSKFKGLKNTVTRERLGPDELYRAVNVDIDDAGQLHRRRGQTPIDTSVPYSDLWVSYDGIVYVVKNGVLGVLTQGYEFLPIQAGIVQTAGYPLSFVQVGHDVYWSGHNQAGIINTIEMTNEPWLGPNLGGNPPTSNGVQAISSPNFWYSPVVNPTIIQPPIAGKLLGPPPLARYLASFNGRIYMASGRTVWYTELFGYRYVDKTKNFWQFEAEVTGIGSVTDGLYIGTTEGVWFVTLEKLLDGQVKPKRVRVMDSGMVPGSLVYIPGELANPVQVGLNVETKVQVSVLFLTAAGYCGGQDGGVCYNFSETEFLFPGAVDSAAMYRFQDGVHQYIATLNSNGTPADNARIGDYVDATIIRGGDVWQGPNDTVRIGDVLTYRYIKG